MSQTAKRAQLEERDTEELMVEGEDFVGNDRGEVPLVHDGVVLTDEWAINSRQSKLRSLKDTYEQFDQLTKRDKRRRYEDRIAAIEESPVIEWPDAEVDSKREAIQARTSVDVSDVDDRLLTSIFLADRHESVTEIETIARKVVKIHLVDDALERTTNNYIELTGVGDCVVVQGRCTYEGEDVNRSFPDSPLQEDEIVTRVATMLDGREWGMF